MLQRNRWLSAGLLFFAACGLALAEAPVTKLSVYPSERTLSQKNRQQLAVTAHFADGKTADVTRLARYDSTDVKTAGVSVRGVVSTFDCAGEAWILVRYGGRLARFRAIVAGSEPAPNVKFPQQTLVDRHTQQQWHKLGLAPSPLCTDEDFIRRASLHLTGLLPAPDEVKSFLQDDDPNNKRDKLIDKLLSSPEHHTYFANLWADALRLPHVSDFRKNYDAQVFYDWLYKSIAQDKPANLLTRELLESRGHVATAPPVFWCASVEKPQQLAEDAVRIFAGANLRCIQCHDHVYEGWKRDSYVGMAALFGQVERKQISVPPKLRSAIPAHVQKIWQVKPLFHGKFLDPQTKQEIAPRLPDSGALTFSPFDDPRRILSEWVQDEQDAILARAIVNRYWAHLFGKGIVDPIDNMHAGNPPANPELLDALARDFMQHHYSVKHLLQTICKSRTYQLSAQADDATDNRHHYFSRFTPQPLPPDILFDLACRLNKHTPAVKNLPQGNKVNLRAALYRTPDFRSHWFHPPAENNNAERCERDRESKYTVQQAAERLASAEIQDKFHRAGGWADQLAKDARTDQSKVEAVFLQLLGREPTAAQLDGTLQFIKGNDDKKQAYEQLIGALMQTKEFIMIR